MNAGRSAFQKKRGCEDYAFELRQDDEKKTATQAERIAQQKALVEEGPSQRRSCSD